jgi:hypothetical protein
MPKNISCKNTGLVVVFTQNQSLALILLYLLFCFLRQGSHCVALAGLALIEICLPLPPGCFFFFWGGGRGRGRSFLRQGLKVSYVGQQTHGLKRMIP